MINLSSDIVTSITGAVSGAIQELWPIIAVLVSIILAFFVLRKILFIISLSKR